MFLEEAVRRTRDRVARSQKAVPERHLRACALEAPPPQDFLQALCRPGIALIAEIKRRSPSRGALRPDADAVALALAYAEAGANAVSVLTEPDFFGGSLEDLAAIRAAFDARATAVPLLRKDLILDTYQVWEARAYGAAALLLIACILTDAELRELFALTCDLGMVPLVEIHDPSEVSRVVPLAPRVVGINNRDLHTLHVDLNTFRQVRPLLPGDILVVAESGVRSPEDVRLLSSWGADAVLVGEALMLAKDAAGAVRALRGERVP